MVPRVGSTSGRAFNTLHSRRNRRWANLVSVAGTRVAFALHLHISAGATRRAAPAPSRIHPHRCAGAARAQNPPRTARPTRRKGRIGLLSSHSAAAAPGDEAARKRERVEKRRRGPKHFCNPRYGNPSAAAPRSHQAPRWANPAGAATGRRCDVGR